MGHEGVTVAADGHEPTSLEGTTMWSTFVTPLSPTASPPTAPRA